MGRPKVYVTRSIPRPGLELLEQSCEVEINPEDRPLTRKELLAAAKGRDGVIGLLTDRIDGEFFDAAAGLKGYANYAVGFDNIDVPEATRRQIPVSNTPGVPDPGHRGNGLGAAPGRVPPGGRIGSGHAHGAMGGLGADAVCGRGFRRPNPGHCGRGPDRHGHGPDVGRFSA